MEILFKALEEEFDNMVDFRRDMHMYPELSHHEEKTPEKIAQFYKDLGLEDVRTKVGGRGVVATLEGGKPGKTVALRADFDALPIQDAKDVEYKSKIDGVMHACGHDVHTSTLLHVAKVLLQNKDEVPGKVVFLHQFAEEVIPGGAKFMIEDGCLDGVDAVFGAHVISTMPFGKVGALPGAFMASGDTFEITIQGKGGHAGMPQHNKDPLTVATTLFQSLQTIVSRDTDPLNSGVVSVTTFNTGQPNFNVIPDKVELKGTVRTLDDETRDNAEERIKQLTKGIADAYGMSADINYTRGYPVVVNDDDETVRILEVQRQVMGEENVIDIKPQTSMEDFGYYLQERPGSFFIVGGALEDKADVYPHHHPNFDVDERAMINIGKLFIATVFDYNGEEQ
ncbi:amidohydrolase [Lacicoccus alkaliphilus]|uniref:Amidohydrolase n=1 Tax=Lacicoccus alkaliphilus DSM 16010 TaxID=1123231 RepID=A0A1M7FY87_9BACL|nr:amidohydrolase [Salinicoccus alkaliphilus]SHM08589.1 amidohydrolase [Salinicoccus alkaliphilus DSM 16010]